jgi:hypothetical protein
MGVELVRCHVSTPSLTLPLQEGGDAVASNGFFGLKQRARCPRSIKPLATSSLPIGILKFHNIIIIL